MSMLKKILAGSLAVVIFLSLDFVFYSNFLKKEIDIGVLKETRDITVGDTVVSVNFAVTESERKQGLSGKEKLAESEGLFFIFEKNGIYPFWMKDMNFPIDIVWVSEDFVVVDITKNAQPDSFPKTFIPRQPIRYVLEVNAGLTDRDMIKIGDVVSDSNLIFAE